MSRTARGSGYFRTSYAQDLALLTTRFERACLAALIVALATFPFVASPFQLEMIKRMDASPIAMTLADVLPALQQGAIDAALSSLPVYTTMQYQDAARYVVDIDQPYISSIIEMSRKWLDGLPPDLQKIVRDDADRRRLIEGLGQSVIRCGWELASYVVMGNHLHLLVKTPRPNLGAGMRSFLSGYAIWSGRRWRR